MVDALGRETQFSYDSMGRPSRTVLPDGHWFSYEYDAVSRPIKRTDERGNAVSYSYDAGGNLTAISDAHGEVINQIFDAAGNRTSVTDANGNTTQYAYNANDQLIRVTYPDGGAILFGYDANGRRTTRTDALGRVSKFEYDPLGQLSAVIDPLNQRTEFRYDESGNVIAQIDANGHSTTWEYDNVGRPLKHSLPLGMFQTFAYDPNGNVTAHTDFNGETTRFEYDAMNRLVEKTFPDGSGIQLTYTATGQRETVTDDRGITRYHYDLRDRLTEVVNSDGQVINYGYDAVGNRTSITTASGTVQYGYDALDRLVAVTDTKGSVTEYEYDASGNRTGVRYPNGVTAEYVFDSLHRLIRVSHRDGDGNILSEQQYLLNLNGQRSQLRDHLGRVIDYQYDALDRLVEERITEAGGSTETLRYTYDAVGNRLSKEGSDGTVIYGYDANDRIQSIDDTLYSYDPNGNTLSVETTAGTTHYGYDYENRLVSVDSAGHQLEYFYDADGERVAKTVGGIRTNFLVDSNREISQVLEESDAAGGLLKQYTFGIGLISQEHNTDTNYYHADAQGSTRALTDSSGDLTDEYIYDAFGELLQKTGITDNDYLYTGQRLESATGQYHLRARDYDPLIGRFTTRDTFPGDATVPLSMNSYLYVHANPVNFVDPTGRFALIDTLVSLVVENALESVDVLVKNQVRLHVKKQAQKSLVKRIGKYAGRATRITNKVIDKLEDVAKKTNTAMFVLGSLIPEVTLNKIVGISGEHSPLLTYLGSGNHHSRSFLRRVSKCGRGPRNGKDCDEYPYSSTSEGGAKNNAHAALIDGRQNRKEGGALGSFYKVCMKNRGILPPGGGTVGATALANVPEGADTAIGVAGLLFSRFLVVPDPIFPGDTVRICVGKTYRAPVPPSASGAPH